MSSLDPTPASAPAADDPRAPRSDPRKGRQRKKKWRQRRDWGGIFAKLLCVAFAIIGLIPLALGGLVRLERVQSWAAERTSNLLAKELGVDASYDLELIPWPLEIAMENVEVPANDGGTPFLKARSVLARPRLFSLLAGKLDFGEVEIEEPQLRAVIRGGKLANLDYRLPETKGDDSEPDLPLSALAFTNGSVDVTVDEARVRSHEIDIDIAIAAMPSDRRPLIPGGLFEISVRAGATALDHAQPDPAAPEYLQVNEDALCELSLRAQVSDEVLVRRLSLDGAVDFDPARGTRPDCKLDEADWRTLALNVEGAHVQLAPTGGVDRVEGRIKTRIPVPIVHRILDFPPTSGWVELDLDEVFLDASVTIPNVRGKLRAADLGIDNKSIARYVRGRVITSNDVVDVNELEVGWSGGDAKIATARLKPLDEGMPIEAKEINFDQITLEDMLDELTTHPRAHVSWAIDRAYLPRFSGTLSPLSLSGPLTAQTRDFAVWDQPHMVKHKRKMMGVDRGIIGGTFRVESYGVVMDRMTVDTGRSRVLTTVALHYEEQLGLVVHEGSYVDLTDVSPLVDIEMKGVAHVTARGLSTFDTPRFGGTLRVDDFDFAGFAIGDVTQSKVAFEPLKITLTEARLRKNKSLVDVPQLSVDFDDGDADVVLQGLLDSHENGMRIRDFFEIVGLVAGEENSSVAMPALDPQWREIDALARGRAHVHYVLGGRRDRCASGNLDVRATMNMDDVNLWGLSFDDGSVDVDYHWQDIKAGAHGLEIRLKSGVLRKGSGNIIASATIDPGARIRADVVGSAIPLDELKAFRSAFSLDEQQTDDVEQRVRPEAKLSFVASLGGSLARMKGIADVDISPMRIGPDILPPSRFTLSFVPEEEPERRIATTRCGHAVTAPFNPQEWAADAPSGHLELAGQLFNGQIQFDDLQLTQQRKQLVSGDLQLVKLDLGAFANLLPGVAFSESPPRGRLTARVVVDELPLDDPGVAEVRIYVDSLEGSQAGDEIRIGKVAEPLVLSGDALRIPKMSVSARMKSGLSGTFAAGGVVSHLSRPDPGLALALTLNPVDLAALGVELPQVDRASGTVRATMAVNGTLNAPKLSGRIDLRNAMLRLKGIPVPFEDINIDVRIDETEARIHRATASVGNTGQLSMSGRLPLDNLDISGGEATLIATDVKVPVADGIKLTTDARLHATYDPKQAGQLALPNVTGRITLKQLQYTRPMNFQPTVGAVVVEQVLSKRGAVETYNPNDDWVRFDVALVSPEPVRIANNLLDMKLEVKRPGVQVSGTNQRFGARGELKILPGSKLFLQRHQFKVRNGTISFDNPTRIAPSLDVHATTEYRRYQTATDTAATATTAGSATSGRWRIAMHAYGDLEAPIVRFTSDPPLSQEDIVLLLQVGQTRAELERGLLTGAIAGVGLEALSAVTGLDKAFRDVPIIDEFRVGTQYSSRTGRPEPTVTLGKRLTDSVRATLTTGLSENREVRSNIEWQHRSGITLHGSYDNVNEVSTNSIGNIGGGIRYRFEFE